MPQRGVRRFLSVVACLTVGFVAVARAAEHTQDSLDTVRANVEQKKAVLLDVRTAEEWNDGHLQVARWLPLSRIQAGVTEDELDRSKIVYCHCRSGRRVLEAAKVLSQQGYDVRPLKQGFEELAKAGFKRADGQNGGRKAVE